MDRITCLLPGGYVDKDGVVHQNVELKPLSGREEEFLAHIRKPASAAAVTVILSRCLWCIGTISPVSEELTRNLLVGDRQYLLLKLREATFGDQVQATIIYPRQDCGKKVDIDFSIKDIPVIGSEDKGPTYKIELSPAAAFIGEHGEEYRDIVFRLPNGDDQEVISPIVSENEDRALFLLLRRCIKRIGSVKDPGDELISMLSPMARMEIEREMDAVAPKVELTFAPRERY